MRRTRLLGVLCAIATIWTIVLMATGGFSVHLWSLRISSKAPRTPLMLALLAGLAAWALTLTDPQTPGMSRVGSRFRRVLLLFLLVLGLNTLHLTTPAPPTDVNNCVFNRDLGPGFRHVLNCDAIEFLALARTPSMVLTWDHPSRQSRPLSFGLPYLVSRPLYAFTWLVEKGPYTPFAPEFLAFALINLVLLVVTMLCFMQVLDMAGTGAPPGIELLFALVVIGANDVTKLFFWSPHTQVFNLFVPCLTIYLNVKLLAAGRALTLRSALLLGAALGVGLLMYGSFAIPVVCACAIQLLHYRKVASASAIASAAIATYGAWVIYVKLTAGFFYSHETAMYHQFVWIGDCAAEGLHACLPRLQDIFLLFLSTLIRVLLVPLVLVFAVRVAQYRWPDTTGDVRPASRHIYLALAYCLFTAAALLALMGDAGNMPRLYWVLIPSLLLVLAIELQRLRLTMPVHHQRRLSALVFASAVVHLAVLVARQGPYQ